MTKIIFGILMVFFGVISVTFVWQTIIKGLCAKHWPTVPGAVMDTKVPESDGEDALVYDAAVMYSYTVDGVVYRGKNRTFADYKSGNRKRAEIIAAQYAPGTSVQVYYRPADPADSVLEPGTNMAMFIILLVPLTFMGLCAAGFLGLIG